jgi:hypothetical protein
VAETAQPGRVCVKKLCVRARAHTLKTLISKKGETRRVCFGFLLCDAVVRMCRSVRVKKL